jgi:acetyltransferase-like isoleucine patch superfamily enzyme
MIPLVRAVLLALLPTGLVRPLVNALGYEISRGCRVGFSWIAVRKLAMHPGSRIGHLNRLKGPAEVILGEGGSIGNLNGIRAPRRGVGVVAPMLVIGKASNITYGHIIDLAASVRIGDFSTLAGARSQLWTHGYVHEQQGAGRYRIDGDIIIENNVSVGSAVVITAGVRIGSGITIGAGAVIAKDLREPGLYVSSPLRHYPPPAEPEARDDLEAVDSSLSVDRVFVRKVS